VTAHPRPPLTTTEPPLDLWRILAAADAASPVDAVEVVAAELGEAFGAEAVSFMIADMGGRALVRLAHVTSATSAAGVRRDEGESATTIPYDGGPAEQTLRTQTVQVLRPGDVHGTPGRWRCSHR
jgi:hypothetical protein